MRKISVCLVDDHTLVRKGLSNLLKTFPRIGEITEAENGMDFINKYRNHWPDVVLLDLEMPKMNGINTAKYLTTNCDDLKIIVLTMFNSENYIAQMLEIGVHSFLTKGVIPDELERAIYSVYDNNFYYNDVLTRVIHKNAIEKFNGQENKPGTALSHREVEVMNLIVRELTHKEIGEKLSISEYTVRNHHRNIMYKLGLKKTVSLVRYAFENGYMESRHS